MATVPIVTEVTKAQLDALVAANKLNEGLQYKVTDLGYIVLATSDSGYIIISQIPYKKWVGILTNNSNVFDFITLENTFDSNIIWIREDVGVYRMQQAVNPSKIYIPNPIPFIDFSGSFDGQMVLLYLEEGSVNNIYMTVMDNTGQTTDSWGINKVFVEVREYY